MTQRPAVISWKYCSLYECLTIVCRGAVCPLVFENTSIMNLAHLINVAAIQSFTDVDSSKCQGESKTVLSCLHNTANFTKIESENCILCTVSASKNSRTGRSSDATLCDEFEADGYCSNLNVCFREDCSSKCKAEYKTWAICVFNDIGCPFLCRKKKDEVKQIE